MARISLLHPTARVRPFPPSFPRGWRDACEQFCHSAADLANVEYILIVHRSRWNEFIDSLFAVPGDGDRSNARVQLFDGERMAEIAVPMPPFGRVVLVCNTGRDCVVDQLNAGAVHATGDVLLGMMDDQSAPAGWDEKLLDLLDPYRVGAGAYPPIVVDLTAEGQDWIAYGALTYAYYAKKGYILHPDFESMYADNFFTWEAQRDACVIDGRGLGFRHRHYTAGETEVDPVYLSQNEPAKYFRGRNTYARLTGIPRLVSLAVCLPGERFESPWVSHWTELFGHLAQNRGFMTMPYFAFTSNVYCTRIELAKGVLEGPIPADYVLWIDDDNYLTPAGFDQLLATLESRPELSGVVGWCWCDMHERDEKDLVKWVMSCGKQGPNMECFRFERSQLLDQGPVITSDDVEAEPGMGFWSGFPVVLMRGEALRQLGHLAFSPVFRSDINYGFSGEDTAFFWRARQLGQKWAVDLRVKVPHIKHRAIEPSGPVAAPEGKTPVGDDAYAVG